MAQTFFIDEDLREDFGLDAIVTLVDAAHISDQLLEVAAAAEQIGFADVLLLNKTDLVSAAQLARVEQQLRAINGTARLVRTHNAQLPLEQVLDLGAFDLERALKVDEAFLQPQRPYEWAGCYRLAPAAISCIPARLQTLPMSTGMSTNTPITITHTGRPSRP